MSKKQLAREIIEVGLVIVVSFSLMVGLAYFVGEMARDKPSARETVRSLREREVAALEEIARNTRKEPPHAN